MWREHAELGEHIGEVREIFEADPIDWSRLAHVLLALEANVARHFAVEETDGYLAEAPNQTSSVQREIEDLRGQHMAMKRELRTIRALCGNRDARIREALEAWLSTLADHEHRENALLAHFESR